MRMMATLAALFAASLGLAPVARAQQATAPAAAAPAFSDQLFAAAAAASDLAELTTSQLAETRGTDAEVKKFAQQMVADHTRTSQELTALAAAKRLTLPRAMSYQDQATGAALANCPPAEFDRDYAKTQLAAHICAVQLFTAETKHGQDPDVRAWAARTLPHLKEHLQMAKRLAKEEMEKSSSESSK